MELSREFVAGSLITHRNSSLNGENQLDPGCGARTHETSDPNE
jgi:hypothetical protein